MIQQATAMSAMDCSWPAMAILCSDASADASAAASAWRQSTTDALAAAAAAAAATSSESVRRSSSCDQAPVSQWTVQWRGCRRAGDWGVGVGPAANDKMDDERMQLTSSAAGTPAILIRKVTTRRRHIHLRTHRLPLHRVSENKTKHSSGFFIKTLAGVDRFASAFAVIDSRENLLHVIRFWTHLKICPQYLVKYCQLQ